MPPRHTYWTIILEGKPTAFRAATQEELAPTLKQLQARHPDAVMMWFARGRLWQSPEHAREALTRRGGGERRGPGWRPGGSHEDPRARFKVPRDEKRRRFAERLRRDLDEPRPDRPQPGEKRGEGEPGRPPRPSGPREWQRDRPSGPRGPKPQWGRGGSGGSRPAGGPRRDDRPRGPGSSERKPSGPRGPEERNRDRKPFRPSGPGRGPQSWRKPGSGGGRGGPGRSGPGRGPGRGGGGRSGGGGGAR